MIVKHACKAPIAKAEIEYKSQPHTEQMINNAWAIYKKRNVLKRGKS